MGVDITTMLMLGIKFEQDEIPEEVQQWYADNNYIINNNPNVEVVLTNGWGDPYSIIIGYVIGSVDEMEDTIVEYKVKDAYEFLSTIEYEIIKFLTNHNLEYLIGREVKLLMFNEFS